MTNNGDDRPDSKVARLIEEYELTGLGEELEVKWTAEGEERMSLRDLADLFNRRLLEHALREASMSAVGREVEMIYRNLVDDVSPGVRTDTRNRLDRNGIDVNRLESDFVTYQAIRTYLKEWRGAKYERPSDAEKIEKDLESIQRLMTRAHSVIDERVETLRDTGRLDVGSYEVFLDAQLLCQSCGRQQTVSDFLERGGCECQVE